jgi:hypothetical protein
LRSPSCDKCHSWPPLPAIRDHLRISSDGIWTLELKKISLINAMCTSYQRGSSSWYRTFLPPLTLVHDKTGQKNPPRTCLVGSNDDVVTHGFTN